MNAFLQKMTRVCHGLARRLDQASGFLIATQAFRLHHRGKTGEALAAIEGFLGVAGADWPVDRYYRKLQVQFSSLAPTTALRFLWVYTFLLGNMGYGDRALDVYRIFLGYPPATTLPDERFMEALRIRCAGLEQDLTAAFLHAYVGLLGLTDRHARGLRLLEHYLCLEGEDFRDRGRLAGKLHIGLKNHGMRGTHEYLFNLTSFLGIVGRNRDGVGVFEAFLGLNPLSIHGAQAQTIRYQDLAGCLAQAMNRWEPGVRAMFITPLFFNLAALESKTTAIETLETALAIKARDYRNHGKLRHRLRVSFKPLKPNMDVHLILELVAMLTEQGRAEDGLAVLMADANLKTEDFVSNRRLRRILAKRNLPPSLSTRYVTTLAAALQQQNREKGAAAVLATLPSWPVI